MTFGPIFGLTGKYTLTDYFTPPEELMCANVPADAWVCSGSSAFIVRREHGEAALAYEARNGWRVGRKTGCEPPNASHSNIERAR